MDRAGALHASPLLGVVDVEAAAQVAARDEAVLEAEALLEERAALLGIACEGAHAREAAQRVLHRNPGMRRDERLLAALVDDELEREPLRILEDQRAVAALPADARLPEVERRMRADAEHDAVHHPRAGAPARRVGVLEERDVGARR